MAFRKRNIAVARPSTGLGGPEANSDRNISGVRPSFLTSQPATSTGCSSLDSFLGGHGGLALGSSFLVEESGTTDFAGALLKYYAAEGICHGHVLHVVGVDGGWVRELPGVAEERGSGGKGINAMKDDEKATEKMKIAWRYEKLGQAGERALRDRSGPASTAPDTGRHETPFCHTFDLTKPLTLPPDANINHIPIPTSSSSSPFDPIIRTLEWKIQTSPPNTIHRLVIPTVLSPALYPSIASQPEHFLRFLHTLRSLLRQHPATLTAMITLPLSLHPRQRALTRWAETLSDGVLELMPFPHLMDVPSETKGTGGKGDDQPQGMLKIHKLPINTERGEGGAGAGNSIGEDLAFTVSRRKFVIKPYSLPPVEGDQEGQEAAGSVTKKDVEF